MVLAGSFAEKKAGDPAKNAEVISLSAVSVIAKIPWENFIPED